MRIAIGRRMRLNTHSMQAIVSSFFLPSKKKAKKQDKAMLWIKKNNKPSKHAIFLPNAVLPCRWRRKLRRHIRDKTYRDIFCIAGEWFQVLFHVLPDCSYCFFLLSFRNFVVHCFPPGWLNNLLLWRCIRQHKAFFLLTEVRLPKRYRSCCSRQSEQRNHRFPAVLLHWLLHNN